jgi:ABC-type microcin C transport system permease subunit YejB
MSLFARKVLIVQVSGTTHLEFFPYRGLASSEQSDCPDFHNKTITKEYTTVLGLSEPST